MNHERSSSSFKKKCHHYIIVYASCKERPNLIKPLTIGHLLKAARER